MSDKLEEILKKDPRYRREAYFFVYDALEYARQKFKKPKHITGRELLIGFKELALKEFGLLAKSVLSYWGIKSTMDVGEIVFNLVNAGLLSKTEEDKKEDFLNIFDFEKEFVKNYQMPPLSKKTIKERLSQESH